MINKNHSPKVLIIFSYLCVCCIFLPVHQVSKCNPVMMRITQETITSLLADTRRSEDGFIHKTDGEARLKYLQEVCAFNLIVLMNL